jgi:hypothetical protein
MRAIRVLHEFVFWSAPHCAAVRCELPKPLPSGDSLLNHSPLELQDFLVM